MKAILTRYLGPTDYRGSRIVATAEGGHRLTIPYPYELSGEDVYRAAAVELADSLGWNSYRLVGGGLPNGDYAFVSCYLDAEHGHERCRACDAPMRGTVRVHHHSEDGVDVTV